MAEQPGAISDAAESTGPGRKSGVTFRETGWSYAGAQPPGAEGSACRDAKINALR